MTRAQRIKGQEDHKVRGDVISSKVMNPFTFREKSVLWKLEF